MQAQRIRSIKRIGEQDTLDLSVESKDHNFYAEGIVVSNCYSYSYITAYTTYLKANYPILFYWASLELAGAETKPHDCIAVIEKEMKRAGYKLLPPDLTESGLGFKIVSDREIRYGLGLIRGISESNLKKVETFCVSGGVAKTGNKFELFQGIKNGGLNIGIGSALVQSGCLGQHDKYIDKNGKEYHSRSRLTLELQTWNILTDAEKGRCLAVYNHPEVGGDVLLAIKYLKEKAVNEKGKPMISESRFATIQKRYTPYKEIYLQNSRNERLAAFFYEKRVLGFSHSQSLSEIFGDYTEGLVTVNEALTLTTGEFCRIIGFVQEDTVYTSKTKAGNRMLRLEVADETGVVMVRVFNDAIDHIQEKNGRLPESGDLCIINAKKMDGDTLFTRPGADGVHIGIQSARIFIKLSELRDFKIEKDSKSKSTEKTT